MTNLKVTKYFDARYRKTYEMPIKFKELRSHFCHSQDKMYFIILVLSLNGSSPIVWKNRKRRAEAAKG